MSLPVRCFTCGFPIGQYELAFTKECFPETENGKLEFFKKNSIDPICCRRHFLGYFNPKEIQNFKKK